MEGNKEGRMKRIMRRLRLHSPRNNDAQCQPLLGPEEDDDFHINGTETGSREQHIYDLNILQGRNTATAKYAAGMTLDDEENTKIDQPIIIKSTVSDEQLLEMVEMAMLDRFTGPQQERLEDQRATRREEKQEVSI